MRLFVINLPQQVDRRNLMMAQLKVARTVAELISAVDGRALSVEEVQANYDDAGARAALGRSMSRGEIGCALSHQSIYRRMIDQGLPWAVILEDDALVGGEFQAALGAISAQLDGARSEIYMLTHVDKYTDWGRRRILRRHWLVKPVRAYRAHCYVITQAAARALLQFNHPIRVPADYWMTFQRAGIVTIRAVVPYCVGSAPCEQNSVIESERRFEETRAAKVGTLRLWDWIEKHLYWKLLYQLGIKQVLRIKKQKLLW